MSGLTVTLYSTPHEVFIQANIIRHLIRGDRAEAKLQYDSLVADVLGSIERRWIRPDDCAEAAEVLNILSFDITFR